MATLSLTPRIRLCRDEAVVQPTVMNLLECAPFLPVFEYVFSPRSKGFQGRPEFSQGTSSAMPSGEDKP